ncbi:MAG: hypothetical protein KZQ83_17065 [gamma proteobacterium symbiont of Taylorina sp.]|nr:hypothetical protein [gamma proteobacterium symbiont of Taylorina sp.]
MNKIIFLFFTVSLALSGIVYAQIPYAVKKVESMPVIDGQDIDIQWQGVQEIKLLDTVANHELFFSAVHNGKSIAIKIRYPDLTENREHKTLVWNETDSMYQTGSKREDTIVLKWPMNKLIKDYRVDSNQPYHADVWYWKAFRTDPLGYADDKYQRYSKVPIKKATRLRSKDGSVFFLQRIGDKGKSAYKNKFTLNHSGNEVAKYEHQKPTGSRSDIKAKGRWDDGFWTIELLRLLDTGNADDISLSVDETYILGLSRYEIAGRKPKKSIEIPLFGSGEVGESINLSFQ